jgi:hypothetical protein
MRFGRELVDPNSLAPDYVRVYDASLDTQYCVSTDDMRRAWSLPLEEVESKPRATLLTFMVNRMSIACDFPTCCTRSGSHVAGCFCVSDCCWTRFGSLGTLDAAAGRETSSRAVTQNRLGC